MFPGPFPDLAIGGGATDLVLLDVLTVGATGEVAEVLPLQYTPPIDLYKVYAQAIDEDPGDPANLVPTNVIEFPAFL